MNHAVQLRLASGVVGVGLGMMSSDLRWAWSHSPYDQGGGWMALAWALLVMALVGFRALPRVGFLIGAVALGAVSWGGDLNVARHLAIVVFMASFAPSLGLAGLIGFSGLAWWPALGWVFAKFMPSDFACLARVGWLALGAGLGMWWVRKYPRESVSS